MGLVLAYIGDGYLAAALPAEDYNDGVEFGPDLRAEDGYEEARAVDVPDDIARKLLRQGCSDQHYGDGYEAAQAAVPYLADGIRPDGGGPARR